MLSTAQIHSASPGSPPGQPFVGSATVCAQNTWISETTESSKYYKKIVEKNREYRTILNDAALSH